MTLWEMECFLFLSLSPFRESNSINPIEIEFLFRDGCRRESIDGESG